MQDFIKRLQSKPDYVKTRILYSASLVAAVVVVGVWFQNFKSQVAEISGTNILSNQATSSNSAPHYARIEYAERNGGQLLIYFQINNDTSDILNFSTDSDIGLVADDQKHSPVQIANRQNQPFVKKVLSHSQAWGILTFDNIQAKRGQIIFDNLYFEQSPQNIFKETLEFDISKLTAPPQIRS